jgi:Cupin domain
VVDASPGSGPKLHKHPYEEVFVVQEGNATFTAGDEVIEVSGGQVVVVPAGVAHKFVNSGAGGAASGRHTRERTVRHRVARGLIWSSGRGGRLDNSPLEWVCWLTVAENLRVARLEVSNPDADHIGGFLDVFDAFEVGVVYVSGDPKGTLTHNSFLQGVCEKACKVEEVRAGYLMDWGDVRAET